jgi:hypothetical protein
MSALTAKRESRLPWWVKLLLGIGVIAVILVGVTHFLGRATTARWERYASKLREGGVPLTFEEIEALRMKIPDERNGARVIERLADQLGKVKTDREDRYVFVLGSGSHPQDFFTGIARYGIEPSRSFLDGYRELLDELSVLRDMPTGRFDLPLDEDPMKMVLPNLSQLRTAGKLEVLDSMIRLIDGDMRGAAETVRIQAHISATLDEHPTVIGRLVQMALDALLVKTIENTLRVGEVDKQTLAQLDEDIEARLEAGTMRWGFLGERAFFITMCDALVAGRLSLDSIASAIGGGPGVQWLPDVLIRQNQMRGAEILTWLVDAADDPKAMHEAAKRINETIPGEPIRHIIVRILLPSLSRAVELHLKATALLECTRIGLAAERFRMHTGRLPSSIQELVPDYLKAVPSDPFNGEPMRFVATDDGIVIYSVGEDGEDDGGLVALQETRPRLPDVGFRLFRLDRRGLLILDEPPPDDE